MNFVHAKSRIFISYSHRGNGLRWCDALRSALHVFEKHHLLDVWQDGRIRGGSFWDDDIKEAMHSASVAVILLTRDALNSDYILRVELPCLAERQAKGNLLVFPVICEPCDWQAHRWLCATQAANGSTPLSSYPQETVDGIFRHLAAEIADRLGQQALDAIADGKARAEANRVYLDKFPLTCGSGLREEKLIGREQELALLDLAFAQPHTAIASLVAWGGVGKSILVQHWLRRLQRQAWFGARHVYAWSFYSQGAREDRQASEDTFLAHALGWFGVKCEPTLSPWDKGRLLAEAVSREPTLLILDGIEPLQYPPGPMGGQLRAPGVQSLLKQLARKAHDTESRSLCLVTTREPLPDLADFERRPAAAWGSALRVDLGNLTEEAGTALLHHAGAKRAGAAAIKADDAELRAASREVDGHALTLNLLGRFLARAHGGDIRRRDLVKFEEADLKEQGGTTFKMLAAFENWFAKSSEFGARQLAVLRMLGLFDRPADAGCIAVLRQPPAITGLTRPLFTMRLAEDTGEVSEQAFPDEDWNTTASFLADFGLIVIQFDSDSGEQLLDCHPLIREWFSKQLLDRHPEAWRAAHGRLYELLKRSTEFHPTTLAGISPLYRAVYHGCHAGEIMDAGENVYWERILRGGDHYTWHNLGAYESELEALACFFEAPWTRPNPTLPAPTQALLLADSSFCLAAVGRLREGVQPLREAIKMRVEQGTLRQAAIGSSNLSGLLLTLGSVDEAIEEAERAVDLANRSQDAFQLVVFQQILNRTTLADALHQAGRREESLQLFRTAESMQIGRGRPDAMLASLQGFRYCSLLLDEAELLAWQIVISDRGSNTLGRIKRWCMKRHCYNVIQRASQTLEWSTRYLGLLDVALDNLTLCRAWLYRSLFDTSFLVSPSSAMGIACQHLDVALEHLRRANHQEMLPLGFLTGALLRFLKGDTSGARTDLDEAWEIAERGPMRLYLADIHLHRARLFFREEHYPWKSPQDDLVAAEKLITACGYHRRNEELADAKKRKRETEKGPGLL